MSGNSRKTLASLVADVLIWMFVTLLVLGLVAAIVALLRFIF